MPAAGLFRHWRLTMRILENVVSGMLAIATLALVVEVVIL
jgi:hypothetical protein